MKKLHFLLSGILIICLIGSSSCAILNKSKGNDAPTLKFKIPVGQSLVFESEASSQIEMEQMGQTISISSKSTGKVKASSLEQLENTCKIEFETLAMTQNVESPMGGGDTDFSEILGLKTTGILSAKGVLEELEGFESYPTISTAMGEDVTPDVFKMGLEQLFFILPDEPVKKGSTWTEEISNEMPYSGGTLSTTGQMIYEVLEKIIVEGHNCFKIKGTAETKTSGTFEQQGTEIILNRTTKINSDIIFSIDKGMYLSTVTSTITDGIIDVPAANMTMPQKITGKSSVKVIF
ncbi:MAG: hypothetical protein HN352_01845 [Bacteroidetes bacterium]|nr:hypothetical protein [Bacteroidota bacterium]MBT4399964.1 hypothetical protein [Bacteroidota bacterium]